MERCHHLWSSPTGNQPPLSCRHLIAEVFLLTQAIAR
jgi:hypothetical protein